jgi:hypothetical protein
MATLYHLLKLGLVIKKCNNCGKYFIPPGAQMLFTVTGLVHTILLRHAKKMVPTGPLRETENDDAESLRRQIYLAKRMRIRRNPDITAYKESFDKWNTEVSKWKKK